MKYLVIGDIHGCYRELMDLIEKSGISDGDGIIALGDIVDRGPASREVVRFFRDRPGSSAILGNHERKHVRSHKGLIAPSLGQYLTRLQFSDSEYPEMVSFLETLPLYIELPDAILVHGALEPGVELEMQLENVLTCSMSGEKYLQARYQRPWYELYDGVKPIIAGHINYGGGDEPTIHRDLVYCIDTDCCHGRSLTGIVLPDFRIVSVKSRGDYWRDSAAKAESIGLTRFHETGLSFEESERYLAIDEGRRDVPPLIEKHRRQLKETIGLAERLLPVLLEKITAVTRSIVEKLRAESGYDSCDPGRQYELFNAAVPAAGLSRFFHMARRGVLTLDKLKRGAGGPEEMIALAKPLRIYYMKKNGEWVSRPME